MRYKNYGFFKAKDEKWVKVNFEEVVYVKTFGNFSVFHFEDNHQTICKSPLIKLQQILPVYFERVHSSFIVNINYINFVDYNSKTIHLNNKINTKLGLKYKTNIERYFIDLKK